MSYRIARSTLALIITFAHKKASCNAQITGRSEFLYACKYIKSIDPIDATSSSAANKFVLGFPRNAGQQNTQELFLYITNQESGTT